MGAGSASLIEALPQVREGPGFASAIGWGGLVAGEPLFAALSPETVTLIVTGGCLYTLGVVFFLMERMPFHYTIWHIFVLVATGVLYSAVLVEISHRAALI